MPRSIVVIAHNIRSTHNIGSIFRTCDGFGVKELVISGYSPYPSTSDDERLPHISAKLTNQIAKTALGAENLVPFRQLEEPSGYIDELKQLGFSVVGLEQDSLSIEIADYKPPQKIVLILGEEVDGISRPLLDQCDSILEIPMHGSKESFNVSVAAGIALYALTSQ